MLDPGEPVNMLNMSPNDPSSFDCALFVSYGLDGVTADSLPTSIVEDKSYAIDRVI